MTKIKTLCVPAVLVTLAFIVSVVPRAVATAEVTFTLTVKSAFLRSGPTWSATRVYSIFQSQRFSVIGRNADSSWLQLDFPGATTEAWVISGFGSVDGDLRSVPVVAATGADGPGAAIASSSLPSSAQPQVSFTLAVRSAFALNAPSFKSTRVYSLFRGATYGVRAKTADGAWLQLDFPYATSEAWVPAAYGSLKGDLNQVPSVASTPIALAAATPTNFPVTLSAAAVPSDPIVPAVSSHTREIYRYGLSLGNSPHAFSKVGDCNSVNPFFLASFDNPKEYSLGNQYLYLQETISNFAGSFSRESQAARIGFNTTSVFDPLWADPKVCQKGESALACEYRLYRPSFAFISLGTNGAWLTDAEYEAGMRRIIEFSLQHGVVPILSTKADDLEGGGRFNEIVVRLAAEYGLPLWNFQRAVQALPNFGLTDDNYHLTWGQPLFDNPANLRRGWQWRNLTALQTLDAVWRAVR